MSRKKIGGTSEAVSQVANLAGHVADAVSVVTEVQRQSEERAKVRAAMVSYLSKYGEVDARLLRSLLDEAESGASISDIGKALAKEGVIGAALLPFSLVFGAVGMGFATPLFSWLAGAFVETFGDGFLTELGPNASWEDNREINLLRRTERKLKKLEKRVREDMRYARGVRYKALSELESAMWWTRAEIRDRIYELHRRNPW